MKSGKTRSLRECLQAVKDRGPKWWDSRHSRAKRLGRKEATKHT